MSDVPDPARHLALEARGKFLFQGSRKLYLKGVPATGSTTGDELLDLGANICWLREPTREALDRIAARGLGVVAQLDLEAALTRSFAGNPSAPSRWSSELRGRLAPLIDHPALLAYSLGGPVPAGVRRWLGDHALEAAIRSAFAGVRGQDPNRPVTFLTDPATIHLDLRFLDLVACSVAEPDLSRYRALLLKLQEIADDRPLVIDVVVPGADFMEEGQYAYALEQRIRMAFNAGVAGAIVPVDRTRTPPGQSRSPAAPPSTTATRPAAGDRPGPASHAPLPGESSTETAVETIRRVFDEVPFPPYYASPRMSIVVCVYNGEQYIEECLEGVHGLDYPDYEVIIVNDGSTDGTLALAERISKKYGFRVVDLGVNQGLSAARNAGMKAATGEIVAYLDSDAYPDRDWLRYLALTFSSTKYAVIGGPNLNPAASDWVIECIDRAPGNPGIVMSDAEVADHVPGCNLAVRRSFLRAIGGFDERYRAGGDDVDFCWRVLKLGGTLGPSPGAMVWHHRRESVRSFLRQQVGYGKGEAALERDWPDRFNSLGHQTRSGLTAGPAPGMPMFLRSHIYQAVPENTSILEQWLVFFPTMPEWPIFMAVLGLLSLPALSWEPFRIFLPPFLFASVVWLARGIQAASICHLRRPGLRSRAVVAGLQLLQPLARLQGRLRAGLTPWRCRCSREITFPTERVLRFPLPPRHSSHEVHRAIERVFRNQKLPFVRGSLELGWDWQVEGGLFGGVHCLSHVSEEEVVIRVCAYVGKIAWMLIAFSLVATTAAALAGAPAMLLIFSMPCLFVTERVLRQTGGAMTSLLAAMRDGPSLSMWELLHPSNQLLEMPPSGSGVVR